MDQQLPGTTGYNNPLRVYVSRKGNNSKIRKDGTQLSYKCRWCPYQSLNLGHTKKHMIGCKHHYLSQGDKRKNALYQCEVRREQQEIYNELELMRPISNEFVRAPMDIEASVQTKLGLIESRLIALQEKVPNFHNANEKAKSIAEAILKEHGSLFLGCIQVELSKVIKSWLDSGIDVEGVKFQIISKILDKFREINFYDLVDSFRKNLDKFQLELENKVLPKVHAKTWSRIKLAYNFMKKYQQINLIHQSVLIQDLMKESLYVRIHVIRYHRKMVTEYSDWFPYKQLPKRLTKYEQLCPRPPTKICLSRVSEEIFSLIQDEEFQLATDLWTATCMGFRKTQLLRIKFLSSSSKLVFGIEIYEQKNKHNTIRLVPNSLRNMIKLFNIQYPMTSERFTRLRSFCLQKFHVFYGLRHLCFTTIMAGLFENHALARVHKDHKTTSKFYIDQQSSAIVNSMFQLEGFNEEVDSDGDRFFLVFDHGGLVLEKKLNNYEKINMAPPFTVDQDIDLKQLDSILQANDQQMKIFLKDSVLNYEEKSQIVSKRYALIAEQRQIKVESFDTLDKVIECLTDLDDIANLSQIIYQEISQKGDITNDNKVIQILSEITQSPIKLVSFKQNSSQPVAEHVIHCQNIEEKQPLVIMKHSSKSGTIYQTEEGERLQSVPSFRQKLQRRAKQLKSYCQNENTPHLRNLAPFCNQCSTKSRYRLQICSESTSPHGYAFCDSCRSKKHQCLDISQGQKERQIVKIFSKDFLETSQFYPSILKKFHMNNIRHIIEEERGLKMINQAKYRLDVPNFSCSLPIFSKKMSDEINYNRRYEQFLPLQIKKSQESRGLGVFAKQKIKTGQLLATYLGVIGTQNSIDVSHDSTFNLGWLINKGMPLNIIIQAKSNCNVGRFLNSANSEDDQNLNCACKYGLLRFGENYEIVILMYSVKQILVGDELLWFYGSKYWQQGQQQLNRQENLQLSKNPSPIQQDMIQVEVAEQKPKKMNTRLKYYSQKIVLVKQPPIFLQEQSEFPKLLLNEKRFSYFIKINHGQVLANFGEQLRWAIASLTKIICALVICERIDPSDWNNFKIIVPQLYIRNEQSRANIKQGYSMTLQDLLHALLIQSGNDAAQAISQIFAQHISEQASGPQKRGIFVDQMNELASPYKIRLFDESGYNENNSATAKQFCLLIEKYYNLEKTKVIFEIMGKQNYSCKIKDEKGKLMGMTFSTTNNLATEYAFGKTAHSKDQRFSFAGLIRSKNKKIQAFVVVLGAQSEAIRTTFLKQVTKLIQRTK